MATYNCTDSTNSAYGSGSFGTCDSQTTTAAPGAPNTGFLMQQALTGPTGLIVVPLLAAILVAIAATIIVKIRKRVTK